MKTLIRTGQTAAALTALLIFSATPATFAATWFLDQNGASPGLWDGVTTPIGSDLTTTTNWSTAAAGTATTTIFSAANNFQIGVSNSDFNGASIFITNTFNGSIGGNPASLVIVSTNVTVTWLGTSANERFNHATTISVTNGSTLNFSGNNYNWNNEPYTLTGNGTMNFISVLGNNDSTSGTGGFIMNMIGGTVNLLQTGIGTFGNATAGGGAGFTLTNGTLNFVSPQSFADVFGDFQSSVTVKLNGGAMDNLSGAPGTINVNNGSYSIGGNFAYIGSSQGMSLGSAAVTLIATPQITVNANTLTIGGVITDNGSGFGLTKAGNGILALTGANTYTGPTTVSAGLLTVSTTSTGSGAYTNADGATLGVSVASVGQSLAMSSLTLGATSGSTLQFDVGLLGNPSVAPIELGSGALTVNGAVNPISFSSISAITNYPVTMPLIHYGTASGNLASFTLGAFPASNPPFQGYISNDISGQIIDLVLTNGLLTAPPGPPKPVTWIGQTNGVNIGNWDSTTMNWISSGVITNYANLTTSGLGDPVTFDDTLTGTTNVILTAALSPATITLNNTFSNYIFTGTGKISGATALVLNGTGALTLDNIGKNDFTGGITINSGTFQIGNSDTNGNPGSGAIVNNGTLVFSRTDSTLGTTLALSLISGGGTVTKNGSGTVTFSGIEPYTGATVVNGGILALSGPNANPSTLSVSSSLTINNGGTVQFQADNVMGNVAPGVPVTINAGGVLTGLATADGGTGTSSHLRGLLTLDGGNLAMSGSQTATHGSWDLDGGVTVPGTNVTSTISALNVVPSEAGGTIFNITNGTAPSGIDLLVSGTLNNASAAADAGIIKNGPGVMVLDNNNTYSHNTTINGGTLQLGMASDATALTSPLGSGGPTNTVTINTGGILNFASSKGVAVGNPIGDDGTGTVVMNSGTNILGGANTYTGNTIVNAGALILTGAGSINNSAAIIIKNATLDASGSSSTVASSGSLSLTNGRFNLGTNLVTGLGSLAISNTTLIFSVNPTTPNIVAGTLTTGGTTNVINITAVPGQPVYPTNITLIKYTTANPGMTDANNNLTTLGLVLPSLGSPAGYLTNNVGNNSIDLVLLSDTLAPIFPVTWNGRANGVNNGNWDIITTSNWVFTADDVTPYFYVDTSAVTFDDMAAGATSVNLTTAVLPSSFNFNNTSKAYTFSGSGKISGGTGLAKAGSGAVTLAETGGDNFNGGITMSAGTLVLSNANVNISGGMTVNGGSLVDQHSGTISGDLTLNSGSVLLDQAGSIAGNLAINSGTVQVGNNDGNGNLPSGTITVGDTLVFSRTNALIVTSVIAGGGALANNGTGTVTLSATETLTGPVVVNAGTLVLNAGNNTAPNGISRSSGLTINTNGTVAVLVDNSLAGHGAAAGTLPIIINAGGLLTGANGADAGVGTSTHIPGLLTLNGGTLANSGTQAQTANGSWNLDDGVATSGGSVVSTIASLNVIPTEVNGTTFDVPAGTTASGIDLLVSGTLINGTSLHDTGINKTDTGTMALDNNNTYALGTTISGGTLQLGMAGDTNKLTSPLGAAAGAVNINSSAILKLASSRGVTVGNVINDDGSGIVLVSSGTNTLTAANTYSGTTLVNGGILALAGLGSINSSASITVSHATFDVSASSSAVASSGALLLTSSTFNLGTNLVTSLNSLAISNSTLTFPVNVGTPNINLAGAAGLLTTGGTTNIINITSAAGLTVFPTNVTLIKYTTADFGITNANNVLTTLGVTLPGVGYLTNNIGNNSIDLVVISVTSPVNTNAATVNFTAVAAGGALQFSWAADHLGWQLYTNAAGLNTAGNWFPVPGSAAVTNETITINPSNPNVFFQLRYP